MGFQIVGQKFTPKEFKDYLIQGVKRQSWVQRIVLHNTGTPSLAQRPGGILTPQHIKNLHAYYEKPESQGGPKGGPWNGGPHLFIDAEGIWVFNALNRRGTHSPSYNGSSWGVEMLGDYSSESFFSGLGQKVHTLAIQAIAALAELQGWPDVNMPRLILHKEDPATTHNCPGKNVLKASFVNEVNYQISPESDLPELTLFANGNQVHGVFAKDGVSYAPVRALMNALGGSVQFDPEDNKIKVTK